MVRFRRLRTLLLVTFLAMAAIPLCLVIGIAHLSAKKVTRSATGETLAALADGTLDLLYRNFAERRGDTQVFVLHPSVQGLDPAATRRFMVSAHPTRVAPPT